MSGQHTQGRLVAAIGHSCYVLHDSDVDMVACEISEVDARRLAACWNACEGLSTDGVEKIAESGNLFDLGGDLLSAWHELAAARALLGEVLSTSARTSVNEALTERIRALLKGEPVDKRSDNITVSDVADAAAHAISLAERAGMVLTVWQEPVKPLAMGNYLTRLDVRPVRGVV